MTRFHLGFLSDEGGATAIEYSLIAALIFLVILAAVTATADATIAMFTLISTAMSG